MRHRVAACSIERLDMDLEAGLVRPVVPGLAHHQHDVASFGIERDPVAALLARRRDDLERATLAEREIVEIVVAQVTLVRIAPEALMRLAFHPARGAEPAPDAVVARPVEKGPAIEEIRARRAEAVLERHEDRVDVEVRIRLARCNVDVEREGLQHLQQIKALRAHYADPSPRPIAGREHAPLRGCPDTPATRA